MSDELFFLHGGGLNGPAPRQAIRARVVSGEIPMSTPVSASNDGPWTPAWDEFGFPPPASPAPAPSAAPQKQRSSTGVIFALLALAVIAYFVWPRSPSFSDADIEATKKSIKTELEKRNKGATVTDVVLVKKAPRELTGFARATLLGAEITQDCVANMDERGAYIWQCK
jgi:hypothetical protein